MAVPLDLVVSVEPIDYQYGSWCRECMLPSGVRITAVCRIGPAASLRTFDRCTDCGGDKVDPPERPDVDHL